MSTDDPIHIYDGPKRRNYCEAKQWTPTPERAQHNGFIGPGPAYAWTPTVKRDRMRTDAFPRLREVANSSLGSAAQQVIGLISFQPPATSEDSVVIPIEKLCPACHLIWSVMQANQVQFRGAKNKPKAARRLLKGLK